MKTISIRELHEKTGAWVRQTARHGEIVVSDRGVAVARLVPQAVERPAPYFASRPLSPAFLKLQRSGKVKGGADSTAMVSNDRDRNGS